VTPGEALKEVAAEFPLADSGAETMSHDQFRQDTQGHRIRTWDLEIEGYEFRCRYDFDTDLVAVESTTLDHFTKAAHARASGPDRVASQLAEEMISERR
jgi:hypothetical protein